MSVKQNLSDLVRIDSVSAHSNREIIDYLAARCGRLGLSVRHFAYTDERGIEKVNVVACAGWSPDGANEVELALVGHTDTVPFDPGWAEALKLTEREGRLYGRGACDTKAFIAAALAAVEAVELEKLARPLALVFTADEEVGCLGAKRLSEARPFAARHAIVGEPTSLRPMRAGKGYCLAEVKVFGREAHSAYPAEGASAIMRAARLVARVGQVAERLKAETHADFDPPFTTVNVGLIGGGTAKNVIAGECRFTLEWRPVPNQAAARVVKLIQAEAELLRAEDAGFDYEIDVLRLDGGVETPADALIVRHLEAATGNRAGTIAFGTEAPQLRELGAEAVVFGPGDIRNAHRTGEFVPAEELERCVEILAGAIREFCF
ncbi:MAG TPA: acetylornithine deacetylase [Pyrinomonadaceae bacterium]|nr:acetylornithine deacetylase [Pyrinomonadaceae bacterium]